MRSGILTVVMLLSTLGFAAVCVPWADRDFQRLNDDSSVNQWYYDTRSASWPQWFRAIQHPCRRLQYAWTWLSLAATVGSGIVVFDPKTWKRPRESGTIITLVALIVSGVTVADHLLTSNWTLGDFWDSYRLGGALECRVPGAIIGAWAVTFGRKVDWRGHLVSGMWMVGVVMRIVHEVLFR